MACIGQSTYFMNYKGHVTFLLFSLTYPLRLYSDGKKTLFGLRLDFSLNPAILFTFQRV